MNRYQERYEVLDTAVYEALGKTKYPVMSRLTSQTQGVQTFGSICWDISTVEIIQDPVIIKLVDVRYKAGMGKNIPFQFLFRIYLATSQEDKLNIWTAALDDALFIDEQTRSLSRVFEDFADTQQQYVAVLNTTLT